MPSVSDLNDLNALVERSDLQYYWEPPDGPSEWKFSRQDIARLHAKLASPC
jgi:hypothetical protein